MKVYIKPDMLISDVELENLLTTNSVNTVKGVDDVTKSDDDFPGGTVDSRRKDIWADEEEEEDQYKY